ncbi:GmrSD restriction endonuclease domain-containing protein, partial [Neisseria sp. P0015.S006]
EHHYPQNPSKYFGLDKLYKIVLVNFGNLYLLSQSKNSIFSNKLPDWKLQYYKEKDTYDILKQAIMMSYDNWTESEIKV